MPVEMAPRVETRMVRCCLCGSDHFKVLYHDELGDQLPTLGYSFSTQTRKTYQIVRCRNCGLVFTNPMPRLATAYAGTIDPHVFESRYQRRTAARHQIRKILRHRRAGRLLDVGCSTGSFLDVAAKYFEVEGIELSRWAREQAQRHHKVLDVSLAELPPTPAYDVVTLWDVIEHLEDPAAELDAIAERMRTGGIIAIYTGDLDAWLPRLLGKQWWWFQGMHLHYFSRKTLTMLLQKAGFEVLEVSINTRYFQLFSLANSMQRYAVCKYLGPILKLPLLRSLLVPLWLSGEMLVLARKQAAAPSPRRLLS